ncbi:Haem-binding domain, putative [Spirosomataceae bacterium]
MQISIFKIRSLFVALSFVFLVNSCKKNTGNEEFLVISDNSPDPIKKAQEVRDKMPIKIADGLQIKLWASDTLAPDPIAMSIDDNGAVYLTRTNRQKNSEFDIRGHQNWMTESIGLQTVEDRRAFLRKTFAPEKSAENSWLKDLNEDGVHDWKDLAVEKEEIWKIEDKNKDGIADVSTRVFNDLYEEITDVAGGLLIREKDAFVATGPDLWRLTDKNKDGFYETKKSISHGYAVHIGFGGHGMSGITEGPDGKIYWQIGDIGANITSVDGKKFEYPNEGVLVRSNPDGTDFEVFASGIRNTHEFVFDQYGNIISSDNDGDHPTERERLVHLVEGADLGWRSNWQYGKYTDNKNNKYKVWMDERLSVPRWEGQAAHIIPPIMNFHNGPTGMQFNPGTAFGKNWLNKFFLVEFVGSPGGSHIWSFGLKQKGASFELDGEKDILSGILPTAIQFGPEGALYAADWVNGWDTKNYGRVWKIDVTEKENDLEDLRKKTLSYMTLKYPLQTDAMLADLIGFEDMRIRKKAQFELVNRGQKGFVVFENTLNTSKNQLTKIHAIWGIGMLARTDAKYSEALLKVLDDTDTEIQAQAAKTLGEVRNKNAVDKLKNLLTSDNSRVKFYATEALGKLGDKSAISNILSMIDKNKDEDIYLRHAGVFALSRLGAETEMLALANNKSKSLRLAAVLVLRRLKSDKIQIFLQDEDEFIAEETARAINDDLSIPVAFPALVKMLNNDKFTSEPLFRRAINVALRVGDKTSLDALINYAKKEKITDELRAEAIAALGTWAEPSLMDRVDGRYRGIIIRDLNQVKQSIEPHVTAFLNAENPETQVAISQLLSNLKIESFNTKLVSIFENTKEPKVKIATLEALSSLNYVGLDKIVQNGLQNEKSEVRVASIGSLSKLNIDENTLNEIVKPIFEKGTIREKQRLIGTLANMPVAKTEKVLGAMIDMMATEKLDKELLLDLSEAVKKTNSESLLAKLNSTKKSDDWFEEFKVALFGGNSWEGRNIFNNNSTAQCVRCHSTNAGVASTVGPNLSKIGSKLTREVLLEALIKPSNRLSPGFGQVSLTLKDGQEITGTLMSENEHELVLATSDAEPTKVALSRIAKRENMPSSMPPMGDILSKREIRDLVEYLAGMK